MKCYLENSTIKCGPGSTGVNLFSTKQLVEVKINTFKGMKLPSHGPHPLIYKI